MINDALRLNVEIAAGPFQFSTISSFPFALLQLQRLFSYNWTSASWSNIADLKAEGVYDGAREGAVRRARGPGSIVAAVT